MTKVKARLFNAYRDGRRTYQGNWHDPACPYSDERCAFWWHGWRDAREDRADRYER